MAESGSNKNSFVIIDCDTGNDDAWAIISLVKAEEKCDYKVLGITCVYGNTTVDHSTVNTLMVLERLGRMDIPVFAGCASNLIDNKHKSSFHGIDGFGGIYKDKPSKDLVQKKHGVLAIHDFIQEHPNQIILIGVGPLTNFAMLYKMYPEDIPKIKEIYLMGGSYQGVGNTSRCAEFNFFTDPESVWIVFHESKCPITIVPWETCLDSSKVLDFNEFRIDKLASNKNLFTDLLDPVETRAYKGVHKNWIPCDAYAALAFIMPKIVKKKTEFYATMELAGNHTRGQLILDHLKKEESNVSIVYEFDMELFKKFFLWVCGHEKFEF